MVTATGADTRQSSVWWLLLLHGIAALLLGLMLVSAPAATLASLMTFIGFFWLISGVLSLVRSVSSTAPSRGFGRCSAGSWESSRASSW